jgi:hypothetical protein
VVGKIAGKMREFLLGAVALRAWGTPMKAWSRVFWFKEERESQIIHYEH